MTSTLICAVTSRWAHVDVVDAEVLDRLLQLVAALVDLDAFFHQGIGDLVRPVAEPNRCPCSPTPSRS
jgi:hypothetical protein